MKYGSVTWHGVTSFVKYEEKQPGDISQNGIRETSCCDNQCYGVRYIRTYIRLERRESTVENEYRATHGSIWFVSVVPCTVCGVRVCDLN